jgi:hypothetical protein
MRKDIIPESLKHELHPLCDKDKAAKVLAFLDSNYVVCIREVADGVGCSNLTAQRHLERIVRAGLAVEKRAGRVRIFISRDMRRDPI